MVAGAQSCFTSIAAGRASAARPHPAFAPLLPRRPKTRVGVFPGCPSGRLSRRGRGCLINTPGSRACGYKTASGRRRWLSPDPMGHDVNPSLYSFCAGNPVGYHWDADGRCLGNDNAPASYITATAPPPVFNYTYQSLDLSAIQPIDLASLPQQPTEAGPAGPAETIGPIPNYNIDGPLIGTDMSPSSPGAQQVAATTAGLYLSVMVPGPEGCVADADAGAANIFYHYTTNPNLEGQGLTVGSGVTSVGDFNAQQAMLNLGIKPPGYVYPVTLDNPLDFLSIDVGTPARNTIPSWRVEVPTLPGSIGAPRPVPPGTPPP